MSFEITTTTPSKVRSAIRVNAQDVIDYVAEKMADGGDEVGLPDGATLFLVTASGDDGKRKSQSIRSNEANGTDMFLEIPFWQNGDGTRTAIGGRARNGEANDDTNGGGEDANG